MQDAQIRRALEELRHEINQSDLAEGPGKERLSTLIADLEARIGNEDLDTTGGLIQQVKESIGHLELEYPRTTSILNQILNTLGGAGI